MKSFEEAIGRNAAASAALCMSMEAVLGHCEKEPVARLVKTVMNISFRYAANHKFIAGNPTKGINLPKRVEKKAYRCYLMC